MLDFDPIPDAKAFAEPWQAQAFALVVHLHQQEVFTWNEWAACLSSVIAEHDDEADGQNYYVHWLEALERLLAKKDVADTDRITDLAAAWQRAAHATPHGLPIELANDPQAQ